MGQAGPAVVQTGPAVPGGRAGQGSAPCRPGDNQGPRPTLVSLHRCPQPSLPTAPPREPHTLLAPLKTSLPAARWAQHSGV